MSVTYLERPVFFMGVRTPFKARSARHASIIIFYWLCGIGPYDRSQNPQIPEPPTVPREFCPSFHKVPTMGRLYKNTRLNFEGTGWVVGLGIPDRRRTFVGNYFQKAKGESHA